MSEDRLSIRRQRLQLDRMRQHDAGITADGKALEEEKPFKFNAGPPDANAEWRQFYAAVKQTTEKMRRSSID